MSGMQLRRLRVSGPEAEPAEIEFGPGLNVVSGPSDTGKSFIVEAIDFMLGGTNPPRAIPETVGYDRASLLIEARDGRRFELRRSLQGGGEVELLTTYAPGGGLEPDRLRVPEEAEERPTTLGVRHAKKKPSVSSHLLDVIGLSGKVVRKNTYNETQALSFRNLAHLVLVAEESIIRKVSPLFSGEATAQTAQTSVFRLLLTGVDDSSLRPVKKPAIAQAEVAAKEEVIGDIVREYQMELRSRLGEGDPLELQDQLERLTSTIEASESAIARRRADFEEQEARRRAAWESKDRLQQRRSEIAALLERFALLDEHYTSDRRRLESVAEAGMFFVALQAETCPLCGAPAGTHSHGGVPHDADINALQASCEKEIAKITKLQEELAKAVNDLRREQTESTQRTDVLMSDYRTADALIRDVLAPALSEARAGHSQLVEKRSEIRQALALVDRIEALKRRQEGIEGARRERVTEPRADLPVAPLQAFAGAFEQLLEAWRFPHEKPVFFEESKHDFVLGNRRRGEQGKGLRALTHSAFSIGLLQTCRTLHRPHVGFVILDSPLVTFREAGAGSVDELGPGERREVKRCFYRDLAERIKADQVIIFENEDPEEEVRRRIVCHLFTKSYDRGRFGFFPKQRPPSIG